MELAEAGFELGGLINAVHAGTFRPNPELNARLTQVRLPLDGPSLLVALLSDREPRRVGPERRPLGHRILDELYAGLPLVAVPLCHENASIGILLVDNFVSGMPIQDETIALLTTLANQATAEIVNNRLHADLTRQLAETEHLYELLRENQNYLLQHERLVDMGKLATTVAHEIKTPLVAIGGFARRALKALEEPERKPRHELSVIIREVQRLERITAEILDYSKEIRLNLEPIDLKATIEDAMEVVETRVAQANIAIDRRYEDGPCEVMADPRRIKQVILNLLENAIDAMSPGDGEKDAGGRLTVSTHLGPEYAELELADTGPGIPHDLFDRVFTPFFTTKAAGSGLGLPVSRRIIADHGGRIRLQAADGGGTCFVIELPRKETLNRTMEEGNHHGQNSRS
jgi:two-component system sensor histidine kinase HydH